MYETLKSALEKELADIESAGLYKKERIITTPQAAVIRTTEGKEVLNFCANNYLGLSSHPRVIEAAKQPLEGGFTKIETFEDPKMLALDMAQVEQEAAALQESYGLPALQRVE